MKKHSRFPDAHTVVLERSLPVPITLAWDYVTKAEYLSKWIAEGDIGPEGSRYFLNQDTDRVPMRMKGGVGGTVKEVKPPHRVVITWAGVKEGVDMPKEESLVTFNLQENGSESLLTLKHEGLLPGFLAMCGAGWDMHVDTMVNHMNGTPRPATPELFNSFLAVYVKDAEAVGDKIGETGKAILETLSSQKK